MTPRSLSPAVLRFVAGPVGRWIIDRVVPVAGPGLDAAERLAVVEHDRPLSTDSAVWVLRGVASNLRYTNRHEAELLTARQPPLSRPEATRAALIPIRKSARWWGLAQDERRDVFETQSHHIRTGVSYLPQVARRLHHSRDLGEQFDFLTWFEYAPADEGDFGRLLGRLRASREWEYVEREVEVRLIRSPDAVRTPRLS